MDLKQLFYFTAIADEGSISAAAKKLFMSQPPLSNQIKLLESELNCILFERGSRNIHLTSAGKTLYDYANSILSLSNTAKLETMAAAKKNNSTIRIGIVSSIICSFALQWIQSFSTEYPGIKFEIVEGDTYELLDKFDSKQIHLALLRTPFNKNQLIYKKLFTDSLVIIGHKKFFVSESSSISLQELSSLPLILYRRWLTIFQDQFLEQNLEMNYYCINDDARTTFYFVDAGMGVGLVPRSAINLIHNPDIICKSIQDYPICSDVVIAYNTANYLPHYSKIFIKYLQEQCLSL